jgi:simple sugar transport system permease protein
MIERQEKHGMRLVLALLPVGMAVGITAAIILLMGQSPTAVFQVFLEGAFGTQVKLADIFIVWVSLVIISSGLLVTFRAGQWNIGAEGQIVLGAIFAVGASRLLELSPGLVAIPLMILAGMAGGALWGLLVGTLKIYGRVHEIFGGLGLNFVATSLTIYLISGPWKPAGTSSIGASKLLPEALWLPTLEGLRLSPVSVILAILVAVVIALSLRGTMWGLQLKAVGRNARGAFMLGVPTTRILFSAYLVCGLCAGLVGALIVTAVRHQLVANIGSGYGFLGILVVLLSGFRATLIPFVAFFFAALGIGSVPLQLRLGLDSALGGVLLGVIVLSYELVQGLRQKYAVSGEQ